MAVLEIHKLWTLGPSTGVSTEAVSAGGYTRELNCYFQTDGVATASMELVTSRNSTGPWVTMGSSQSLSTGATVVPGFTGPYLYLSVRLISINSTANRVFAELVGN